MAAPPTTATTNTTEKRLHDHIPAWALGAALTGLVIFTSTRYPMPTTGLVIASAIMFAACLWSARQVLGGRHAVKFAALALSIGWFAEQMGSSRGWFFGRYTYTDVLGPQLGNVPLVIPIMWFALCFTGYTLASLLLWRQPVLARPGWISGGLTAWLAAMIVTAFDLGADPYFVFVLKAWIMAKTDGGWFGETLQGFAGWMVIACAIVAAFQGWSAPLATPEVNTPNRRATLIPLALYASALVFQLAFGHPVEIRAIAFFAMGLPLTVACVAWWAWQARHQGTNT